MTFRIPVKEWEGTKRFSQWTTSLPLHSDLRVTATADRSRLRRRVPAVAVARIRVQRQYVAAVDVADDRRQHCGCGISTCSRLPGALLSRRSRDDDRRRATAHFTDAATRVQEEFFGL